MITMARANCRRWLSASFVLCLGPFACDRANPGPPSPASAEPGTEPRAARQVRVAAAADLKFAMDEVIAEFHKQARGTEVTATYGSSGNFYAQLSNKAPYDIFFSADIAYPRRLVEAGLASQETEFRYAIGQIVVWVRENSEVDVEKLGLESLVQDSIRKIAIANPRHAPYGRAANAAMRHMGIIDRVKDKLVLGENIAQAAQYVETGAADAGIIALSLALSPAMREKGRYWVVPMDAYPRLEQGGVILSWAKDAEATMQFRNFVTSERGRDILKKYGFALPGE